MSVDLRSFEDRCFAGTDGSRTFLENRDLVASAIDETSERTVPLDLSLRTGIVLAQSLRSETRASEPTRLREAFRDRSVGLTVYAGGILRLSMPGTPLAVENRTLLSNALIRTAEPIPTSFTTTSG